LLKQWDADFNKIGENCMILQTLKKDKIAENGCKKMRNIWLWRYQKSQERENSDRKTFFIT